MDTDTYDLRITMRVKIKKWRIDDQSDPDNREWNVIVYDRNLKEWINVGTLNRPGEESYLESIEEL
jgi:hypothetical protein